MLIPLMKELQDHPQTGMIATFVAAITPYLEFLGIIGQVVVWTLGVTVGTLTAWAKILEIKERRKNRKDVKKH
jgi:hypothetical protein